MKELYEAGANVLGFAIAMAVSVASSRFGIVAYSWDWWVVIMVAVVLLWTTCRALLAFIEGGRELEVIR